MRNSEEIPVHNMSEAEEMTAVSGSMRNQIRREFPHGEVDVRTYSPLALAFLGDGVYSLIIRTMIVEQGNRPAEKLHNETKRYVSAAAQAKIGDAIQDLLTPEERRIYRSGQHANPEHPARSVDRETYMKATALEALCGWLYLQDRTDRFLELLRTGMERVENAS